ncbi:jg17759 [Pararge aegeria aegeria]|uniref:Jg17759 protein n=1 Tax=Pararge aegeria aegeria TaxID=348720 RepID=A0A8S4RCN8_9NEOP|nr:jg17759 [Pararge aegeria aegeria]
MSREAEVGRAHSSEYLWMLEFQGVGVATPHRPARWTDDIKRVAESRWIQADQNRGVWGALQKTSSPAVDVNRLNCCTTVF